ncbi:MAG: polysaccharide deacetylase family protein [Burkholderiales bacterium]|nr:polysaccharide deacetylase family protein [Burkholderiales bacterium]
MGKRGVCVAASLVAILLAVPPAAHAACSGTLYLTLDTSVMTQAENVARILAKHHVQATFFIANEPTFRGDHSLDASWGEYWRTRAAEGHAFGTHTWDHGYFRGDLPGGKVKYVRGREVRELDANGVCEELRRVDTRFRELTGRGLDPLWRAPGGHTTPNALAAAQACGYRHVLWSRAGFLGDELPSDKYPNDVLLQRALRNLRDGDILVMHLGIRSRQDPFAPMLDPLLEGLKQRGFCFATLAPARVN